MNNKDWALEVVTFFFSFAAVVFVPGPPTWAAPFAHKFVQRFRSRMHRNRLPAEKRNGLQPAFATGGKTIRRTFMKNLSYRTRVAIAATLAALLPLQAVAVQDQPSQKPNEVAVSADHAQNPSVTNSRKLELKEGSPVMLSLASALNSKSTHEGDAVTFTVTDDVKVDNAIVVRAGTTAIGHIARVKKSGMMGRGGELSIDLDYMQVNDTVVRLRGSRGKDGDDKTGAVVGLTVAFGLVGFMKHGKQAEIPAGTNVHAYVDRTIELPALSTVATSTESDR